MGLEPAGVSWISKFPTGKTTAGLEEPFQSRVEEFITVLERAGAKVSIAATDRPPERAYLMHWAWRIAREGYDPKHVPTTPGVPILWTREGAEAMVAAYKLAYKPSLTSRHIPVPPKKALAIDMTITWGITLSIKDKGGKEWLLNPGDTVSLWAIGATFGVIKLKSDPPHWSQDGR